MPILHLDIIQFKNGERFPFLKDSESGKPLSYPMLYTISELRSKNLSVNTIISDMRALMHLYAWAEREGTDVERRFFSGNQRKKGRRFGVL